MNDYFGAPLDPEDEPFLDEALARLRQIGPPLAARVANRLAISSALEAGAVVRPSRSRWWQRSIAVPVPLAASLLLATALSMGFGLQGWNRTPTSDAPAEHQAVPGFQETSPQGAATKRVAPRSAAPHTVARASGDANIGPTVQYYAVETYLCGVGRIHSESRYLNKEQKP